MKGMLDFLEKAGLVKKDTPEVLVDAGPGVDSTLAVSAAPANPLLVDLPTPPAGNTGATLNLDDIYARHGVGPSLYPAERLLRLVEGLSAMDPATRLMAIKAMDAADESWTIADPLADAGAKLTALAAHGDGLKVIMQQLEQETQAQLDNALARQEQVVGDIRKQIAELEALVARELARAAQETATHQAALQAARDQTTRELSEMAAVSQRLQSLSVQFGEPPTPQDQ